MTALFKSLMSQSPRSQPSTIRQDLCEVSHPEGLRPSGREKGDPNSSTDLRKTSEIRGEGRDRPPILWSNMRKGSADRMQTARLQGEREVGFRRVLYASTRKVTCRPPLTRSSRGHVCLTLYPGARSKRDNRPRAIDAVNSLR